MKKGEDIMISESRIVVRYAETDKMGIVHHSVSPIWYEVGRTEFLRKIGLSYSQMEEIGIFTPLVELSSKYFEPADYEDELVVKTKIGKMTPARIVIEYEIYKEGKEKPINIGSTTHALVGKDLKPINVKKHFPEIYETLKKCEDNT